MVVFQTISDAAEKSVISASNHSDPTRLKGPDGAGGGGGHACVIMLDL